MYCLHQKVTVILLLVFTLLVTTKQYFGDPISCIGDAEKFNNAYNSYCWIYGTFTTRSQLDGENEDWGFLRILDMTYLLFISLSVDEIATVS